TRGDLDCVYFNDLESSLSSGIPIEGLALSSDKGGAGAAGGQLGPEWPPRDDDRGFGGGTTALQRSLGPAPLRTPSSWLPPPPSPAISSIVLEMQSLELLHHFTTMTYAT